ncbi:MAG: hypothetical protein PWQ70_1700 [Clostridiales bacterium]|nr:hypothetical protein [Clostridiales bacterium]
MMEGDVLMKQKMKHMTMLLTVVVVMLFTVPVQAENENIMVFTLEQAVQKGLENSIVLKQVENEINLSAVAEKRAKYLKKKLDDSDDKISDARALLNQKQREIDNSDLPDEVKKQLSEQLNKEREQLSKGMSRLESALEEAGATLSDKLSMSELGSLGVGSTGDLMTTMANVAYEINEASYDMYKNQIALLIQKSYYDVLKAQKILEVKQKAMERGKKQYKFAKASYEEGMKAKDDMLLAKTYYKGTQIEYQKALGEYNNALIQLKKNMNISLDSKIVLSDVMTDKVQEPNLEEGLQSGLQKRLEIKKSLGEVLVYNLNLEVSKKKYPENTFQYKEAALLKEKAILNYEAVRLDVENSIYQSYETLKSAGEMLKISKEMVAQAQESLEIAEYKYQEGFGVENSLLKKLDLESSAGTIVEVLAAEENLAAIATVK